MLKPRSVGWFLLLGMLMARGSCLSFSWSEIFSWEGRLMVFELWSKLEALCALLYLAAVLGLLFWQRWAVPLLYETGIADLAVNALGGIGFYLQGGEELRSQVPWYAIVWPMLFAMVFSGFFVWIGWWLRTQPEAWWAKPHSWRWQHSIHGGPYPSLRHR